MRQGRIRFVPCTKNQRRGNRFGPRSFLRPEPNALSRPARRPFGGLAHAAQTFTLHQIPRPARRRGRDAQHLGAWGVSPSGSPEGSALWCCPHRTPPRRGAGVQRAEPSGAVCGGHPFPYWVPLKRWAAAAAPLRIISSAACQARCAASSIFCRSSP